MADLISIDEFSEALTNILEQEAQNADEVLDEVITRRSKQYRDKLETKSPKDTGEYAKGWKVKTATRNREKVKVVYNGAKPRLTHLLEYGTQRQAPQPHIRPALEQTKDETMNDLMERL